MPGVTGYPDITNASPMQGPSQIKDQSDHWDDIEDRDYPTASAFPAAASTYGGRLVFALDTGVLYINNGSAWQPVTDWIDVTTSLNPASWFPGGLSANSDLGVWRLGKMIKLSLNVHKTSNFTAGDGLGTLPTAIRPVKSERTGGVFYSAAWGMCGVEIQSTGAMRILQVYATVTQDMQAEFVYRTA